MKLLNVIQRYPPAIGGSELWCQEISRELAARGHSVRAATLDVDQEEEYWKDPLDSDRRLALGRWMLDGRVAVRRYRRSLPLYWIYHLVYRGLLDALGGVYFYGPHSLEMYANLRREMEWADAVLLHTLPHPHNLVAFAAARRMAKPVVAVPYFHPGHPYYERPIHYAFLRRCDAVVALTRFEADHLARYGVDRARIVVAGTGIDPADYRPAAGDDFRARLAERYGVRPEDRVVTFLGRKIEEKGIADLIAAVRSLAAELPIRLFLLGPRFAWYDGLYAALPADARERIVDVGTVSHRDKVEFLHASDLLVLPSLYESFGIVFLEAWLCGAAVIGSNGGAVPSVIDDCGFLSPVRDPAALAATLRDALSDPARLRAMAERGRRRVLERYTWPRIGDAVEGSIRGVLAARGVRRRVLVCSNAYPPRAIGGAEVAAHAHAKGLAARGYDVRVFAGELDASRPRHSLRADRHDGLHVDRIALHGEDYSWEYVNFAQPAIEALFERALDEFAPEIVHFHNLVGLSAGLVARARRRGIKTLLTLHDYWGVCFKNTLLKTPDTACRDTSRCHECMRTFPGSPGLPVRLRRDYVRRALLDADCAIAPSAALGARYVEDGFPPSRLRVIGYGIDPTRFARIERAGVPQARFLFVGYLGAHKGIRVLLDALAKLARRDDWSLAIAGDGELRAALEERARTLGLGDRVRFLGALDHGEIERAYAAADAMILPSLWPENQPVSILEAMASGLAVVASAIGGIPELVEDGVTGLLFPPGDAVALADRLAHLLDDRVLLARLGANALGKASTMTIDATIDALVALCEEEHRADPDADRGPSDWPIACVGRRFDPASLEVAESPALDELRVRLAHVDWLDDAALAAMRLVWVVDPDVTIEELAPHLRHGVPLLVPQASAALRELCRSRGAGLYYADAEDVIAVLRHLAAEPEAARAMGDAARLALFEDSGLLHAGAAA